MAETQDPRAETSNDTTVRSRVYERRFDPSQQQSRTDKALEDQQKKSQEDEESGPDPLAFLARASPKAALIMALLGVDPLKKEREAKKEEEQQKLKNRNQELQERLLREHFLDAEDRLRLDPEQQQELDLLRSRIGQDIGDPTAFQKKLLLDRKALMDSLRDIEGALGYPLSQINLRNPDQLTQLELAIPESMEKETVLRSLADIARINETLETVSKAAPLLKRSFEYEQLMQKMPASVRAIREQLGMRVPQPAAPRAPDTSSWDSQPYLMNGMPNPNAAPQPQRDDNLRDVVEQAATRIGVGQGTDADWRVVNEALGVDMPEEVKARMGVGVPGADQRPGSPGPMPAQQALEQVIGGPVPPTAGPRTKTQEQFDAARTTGQVQAQLDEVVPRDLWFRGWGRIGGAVGDAASSVYGAAGDAASAVQGGLEDLYRMTPGGEERVGRSGSPERAARRDAYGQNSLSNLLMRGMDSAITDYTQTPDPRMLGLQQGLDLGGQYNQGTGQNVDMLAREPSMFGGGPEAAGQVFDAVLRREAELRRLEEARAAQTLAQQLRARHRAQQEGR